MSAFIKTNDWHYNSASVFSIKMAVNDMLATNSFYPTINYGPFKI